MADAMGYSLALLRSLANLPCKKLRCVPPPALSGKTLVFVTARITVCPHSLEIVASVSYVWGRERGRSGFARAFQPALFVSAFPVPFVRAAAVSVPPAHTISQ